MAGSLRHIVSPDGSFSMDMIERMGEAEEALEECFDLIAFACQQNPNFLIEAEAAQVRFLPPRTTPLKRIPSDP